MLKINNSDGSNLASNSAEDTKSFFHYRHQSFQYFHFFQSSVNNLVKDKNVINDLHPPIKMLYFLLE